MDIIKSVEHEQLKNKIPELRVGNTVRVHQRIKEGNRERVQVFEGIIIKKQGGGVNATFTVRKIAYGVGVEKTFMVHSPMVEKVEVVRVGKARRAKLYYLRDRVGKAAKTKENIGARIENKEIIIKEGFFFILLFAFTFSMTVNPSITGKITSIRTISGASSIMK